MWTHWFYLHKLQKIDTDLISISIFNMTYLIMISCCTHSHRKFEYYFPLFNYALNK